VLLQHPHLLLEVMSLLLEVMNRIIEEKVMSLDSAQARQLRVRALLGLKV